MSDYLSFVANKTHRVPPSGFEPSDLVVPLFDWQADLVRWAVRRGRAALFADTGLGKTRMQIEWARQIAEHTGWPVLILAPLAVAEQTRREAEECGVEIVHSRDGSYVETGIVITNYERLHKFTISDFGGVVLDESSILKSFDGKTRSELIAAFADTEYRLCCTATPSPNDHSELGNHSEFLGVMPRVEMLSEFFCHDGGETAKWRLKGHARADFWNWVSTWAATIRKPSDLGYEDGAFALPPLVMHEHVVSSAPQDTGLLFEVEALTLEEQRRARRATIGSRVERAAELVNGNDRPWLIWCDLNSESEALSAALDGAVEVTGSMDIDEKEEKLAGFPLGRYRVLVSKSSICGFGLNFQHCADVVFVGVTHSFEQFYQAVRRTWRFGQKHPVHCHVITSEAEGEVVANLKRKEALAEQLHDEMSGYVKRFVYESVTSKKSARVEYRPAQKMRIPKWLKAA